MAHKPSMSESMEKFSSLVKKILNKYYGQHLLQPEDREKFMSHVTSELERLMGKELRKHKLVLNVRPDPDDQTTVLIGVKEK